MAYFSGEMPDNYEQKCLCTLVLDVSGSMSGEPMRALNRGLQDFYAAIEDDLIAASRLEVSIISFGNEIRVLQEPALINAFDMPVLEAKGGTPLVDGVLMALKRTEERKAWYKETGQPYYRPIVVLITDGEPDANQNVELLSKEIRDAVDARRCTFFGLGVRGYNDTMMRQFCPPSAPPKALDGYKFSEFFKWLSNSIGIITKSKEGDAINLPPVDDWAQMKF